MDGEPLEAEEANGFAPLEMAVLRAVVLQTGSSALDFQIASARVIARENTGAGLLTTLEVVGDSPPLVEMSPLGDIRVSIDGLAYGMGFLIFLKEGRLDMLEGYSYGENTSELDFERVAFHSVAPRM